MDTIEHFKSKGQELPCNMWEIWNSDMSKVYHYAKSSRPNGPARFMINGEHTTEEQIRKELNID